MHPLPNVFEIWRERGRVLPVTVRLYRWHPDRWVTVTRISDVKEYPDGRIYGKAYVENAWYNFYDRRPGEKLLQCAGCYQWIAKR
jgi:hypothetical protein